MKHFDTWCFSELKNILPVIAHLIGGSAHVLRSAEHEWSNVVGYVRSTNWVVCHVENARTSLEFFFNWAIAPRATAIHCLLLQRDNRCTFTDLYRWFHSCIFSVFIFSVINCARERKWIVPKLEAAYPFNSVFHENIVISKYIYLDVW